MSGRFQNPTARLFALLQMLEETLVKFVGWPQILLEKPRPIGRHVVHRIELIAEKARAHERNPFLGELGAGCMNVVKRRGKPTQRAQALVCALDSFLLLISSRWRWRHHFPTQRRAMIRIGRKKHVQQSRPTARQADDENRLSYLLVHDLGKELPIALY